MQRSFRSYQKVRSQTLKQVEKEREGCGGAEEERGGGEAEEGEEGCVEDSELKGEVGEGEPDEGEAGLCGVEDVDAEDGCVEY